jgi:hypothetical protein
MKMRMVALLAAATVVAKGLDAQEPRTRDSAGVRIIENPARSSAPVRFALGVTPVMDVGGLDDNPANEFNHRQGYLRGVLLSNGGLVVTDVNRLHFFDAKGKRIAIVGRDGDGPGEFRYIISICRARGDTLVVSDSRTSRLTVLDGKGAFIRNIPQPNRASPPFDGCLSDGFVLQKLESTPNGPRALVVTKHRLDGSLVDTAGVFDFGAFDMSTQREPQVVAVGSSVYFAKGFGDLLGITGSGRTIVRTADPLVEVSAEEREQGWAATIPRNTPPDQVKQRMDRMRSMPADKHWPAHRRVYADADGRLWMQDFQRNFKAEHGWTAFDPSGRIVGRILIPAQAARFEIVGFGKNQVMVARTDDDDALHMTVYQISPGRR